jgi:hypothetical protein
MVHLAWDASPDPTVTGYRIHAGQRSGVYTLANDVGNVLDGAIDLPTLGHWFTAVGAYNAAQQEALGAELSVYVAPADVVISPYVPNRFRARHGAGGGGPLTGVRVCSISAGRMIMDGQPIFPLGFFHVTHVGTEADLRNTITLTAAAGCNAVICGHHQGFDYAGCVDFAATKRLVVSTEFAANPSLLTTMIATFGTSPGVFGWNIADDVDAGTKTHAEIQALFNQVNTSDPNHLATMSGFRAPNEPGPEGVTIATFYDVGDVFGMQRYPVEYAIATSGIHQVYQSNKATVDAANPNICVIANDQTMNWNNVNGTRFPTPAEARNMAYQSLAAGVRGIMFYTFFEGPGTTLSTASPALWADMQLTIPEINTLAPVLLDGVRTQPISDPVNDRMVTYWVHQSSVTVIVVNSSLTTAKAFSFALPPGTTGPLTPMFPGRPSGMTFSGGVLSGTVQPLDVHVYRLAMA